MYTSSAVCRATWHLMKQLICAYPYLAPLKSTVLFFSTSYDRGTSIVHTLKTENLTLGEISQCHTENFCQDLHPCLLGWAYTLSSSSTVSICPACSLFGSSVCYSLPPVWFLQFSIRDPSSLHPELSACLPPPSLGPSSLNPSLGQSPRPLAFLAGE